MNKRNKKKGFTLIEMIVVVAIIAILAGIAVPQVTKQINNSKKSADIANAKTIANLIQQQIAEGNTIAESKTNYSEVTSTVLNNNTVPQVKYKSGYVFVYKLDIDNNVLIVGVSDKDKNGIIQANTITLYPNVGTGY
ncbi:MAG: type II secretion system GspH family protein [Caloramator sp.]|nr:type II secretion system GspH family protein [Caloramator sp.]